MAAQTEETSATKYKKITRECMEKASVGEKFKSTKYEHMKLSINFSANCHPFKELLQNMVDAAISVHKSQHKNSKHLNFVEIDHGKERDISKCQMIVTDTNIILARFSWDFKRSKSTRMSKIIFESFNVDMKRSDFDFGHTNKGHHAKLHGLGLNSAICSLVRADLNVDMYMAFNDGDGGYTTNPRRIIYEKWNPYLSNDGKEDVKYTIEYIKTPPHRDSFRIEISSEDLTVKDIDVLLQNILWWQGDVPEKDKDGIRRIPDMHNYAKNFVLSTDNTLFRAQKPMKIYFGIPIRGCPRDLLSSKNLLFSYNLATVENLYDYDELLRQIGICWDDRLQKKHKNHMIHGQQFVTKLLSLDPNKINRVLEISALDYIGDAATMTLKEAFTLVSKKNPNIIHLSKNQNTKDVDEYIRREKKTVHYHNGKIIDKVGGSFDALIKAINGSYQDMIRFPDVKAMDKIYMLIADSFKDENIDVCFVDAPVDMGTFRKAYNEDKIAMNVNTLADSSLENIVGMVVYHTHAKPCVIENVLSKIQTLELQHLRLENKSLKVKIQSDKKQIEFLKEKAGLAKSTKNYIDDLEDKLKKEQIANSKLQSFLNNIHKIVDKSRENNDNRTIPTSLKRTIQDDENEETMKRKKIK